MNKVIKEQLTKCKIANIPSFDDNTTELFIEKTGTNAINQYHLNKYYINY